MTQNSFTGLFKKPKKQFYLGCGALSGGGPKSAIFFTKQLLFAWLHSLVS